MKKQFDGKVALVTGAGSGIGRATAIALAGAGAKVVVSDIVSTGGEDTVRRIKEAGDEAIFVKTDVSETAEVERLINKVIETYGRIDCAFNNAGVEARAFVPVADHTEENWDIINKVNLKGVFLCMKYEIPHMIKQGGGSIVNTSSIAGAFIGWPSNGIYCATKGGVTALTKAAALDYALNNIRVNCVCPGVIHTGMMDRYLGTDVEKLKPTVDALTPIGRMGRPEEVAAVAVFLLSDAASFVTGTAIPVDGALSAQ